VTSKVKTKIMRVLATDSRLACSNDYSFTP